MVVANNNEIDETKNAGKSTMIVMTMDAAVRRGVHRLIEHIQGFIWSHWMLPLGECLLRCIAVADEFE